MAKTFFVYIATNYSKTVLYTGMTNSLSRRGREHASGKGARFTAKYKAKYLIYVEQTRYVNNAIAREKEIKGWTRKKKLELIKKFNPKLTLYDWNEADLRPVDTSR